MADTDLSPREKALVEAVRAVSCFRKVPKPGLRVGIDMAQVYEIHEALRAYDPPKPKVPQIPAWDEFKELTTKLGGAIGGDFVGNEFCKPPSLPSVSKDQYNAIRTLTSKEAE